jgi:hypothetical protein
VNAVAAILDQSHLLSKYCGVCSYLYLMDI